MAREAKENEILLLAILETLGWLLIFPHMTTRHGEPLKDWGLEPCGGLEPPTSSCAHRRGRTPPRARRTRSGPGAASLGSPAAVYHSWRSGAANSRLLRRNKHVEEASSAASPPEEVGVDRGMDRDHYVRAFDLPYLSDGESYLGSYPVHLWAGLIEKMGANTFPLWGIAKSYDCFHAERGNRRVNIGASGRDEPRVSGDPIRAPFR